MLCALGAPSHEVHPCGGEEEGAGLFLTLDLCCSTSTLCRGDKRKELASGGQNVSMNFYYSDAVQQNTTKPQGHTAINIYLVQGLALFFFKG